MSQLTVKMVRSIWGIQLRSFNDLHQYLNKKHSRKKTKLQRIMQELQDENNRIQMRIDLFLSPGSDPASKLTPPDVRSSNFALDESWFEPQHHFTIRFKKRLFGLNVKKVHSYIGELTRMQRDELQEMLKELSALMEEREQLLIRLSSFESTNHSEVAAASPEILKEEAHVQEATAEKEMHQEAAPVKEGINAENMRERRKEHLKRQIILAQMFMEFSQIQMQQWKEQFKEKFEAQIKDQLLLKLKNHLLTEQPDETEEDWREIQEIIRQKIMAGQKQIKSRSNVVAFQHKGRRQSMPNLTATPYKRRLTVNGTNFWDEDIESLLFQADVLYENEGVTYVPYSGHPEMIVESDSIHQERFIESKQNPAITTQAYLLRKKYIVGKLAGADLKDSSGKIIVAKNEVITEEVMNQAEQQGKLAELIVNMTIPGLGE